MVSLVPPVPGDVQYCSSRLQEMILMYLSYIKQEKRKREKMESDRLWLKAREVTEKRKIFFRTQEKRDTIKKVWPCHAI